MSQEKITEENEKKIFFLSHYQVAKRNIVRLNEQLVELRLNKTHPSVVNDGMPHGFHKSDLSDYIVKVEDIEQKIICARYTQICAFKEVWERIEDMKNQQEKTLLTYRYLRGMKWEEIAVAMAISWRHTLRLHKRCLGNFKMS